MEIRTLGFRGCLNNERFDETLNGGNESNLRYSFEKSEVDSITK
jgi:hypothetical protein